MTGKTIVTHNGDFHADELFAVATILLFEKKHCQIIRTREESLIHNAEYVVDVGGVHNPDNNRFDHHQEGGAGERENGVPYAAFGLTWKKLGASVSGSAEVAAQVDEKLVQSMDCHDNGKADLLPFYPDVYPYLLSDALFAFHSTWKEKERNTDEVFMEVLTFVKKILEREIVRATDKLAAQDKVEEAYAQSEDKRIIVLDVPYSWGEVLSKYPEPLYVVRPHYESGTWRIMAVRNDPHTFLNRKDFPKNWGGKRDLELEKETGVTGAVFCHKALFLAVAKTKEGALALANKAVEA